MFGRWELARARDLVQPVRPALSLFASLSPSLTSRAAAATHCTARAPLALHHTATPLPPALAPLARLAAPPLPLPASAPPSGGPAPTPPTHPRPSLASSPLGSAPLPQRLHYRRRSPARRHQPAWPAPLRWPPAAGPKPLHIPGRPSAGAPAPAPGHRSVSRST